MPDAFDQNALNPASLMMSPQDAAMGQAQAQAAAINRLRVAARRMGYIPTLAGQSKAIGQDADTQQKALADLVERHASLGQKQQELEEKKQALELQGREQIVVHNPYGPSTLAPKYAPQAGVQALAAASPRARATPKDLDDMPVPNTGGQITPRMVDLAADEIATSGKATSNQRGQLGQLLQIMGNRRFAEKYPGLIPAKVSADYVSDTNSRKNLQKQVDSVDAFEQTALGNAKRYEDLMDKVGDTGSPLLNQPIRALQSRALGNPQISGLVAAHQAAANEIAKVLSGSMGNAPLSDSARHEASRMLPDPMSATPNQVRAALKVMRADMETRRQSYRDQLGAIDSRIGAKVTGARANKPAAQATAAPSPSAVAVINEAGKSGTVPADKVDEWLKANHQRRRK